METLILISVGLSAVVFAHLLALQRRPRAILGLLLAAGVLYAAIHWYLGTVQGWNALALGIFALVAVMPFGAGLVLGAITGWLHLWWTTSRRSG